jgi:hypothetical protein
VGGDCWGAIYFLYETPSGRATMEWGELVFEAGSGIWQQLGILAGGRSCSRPPLLIGR